MKEVINQVEDALEQHSIALVIVEPIAHDGGVLVPPEGFLAELRRVTTASNTKLCIDEVKVGLGRTGRFLAYSSDHMFDDPASAPDAVTLGKTLGGGVPVSAAVMSAELADASYGELLLTLNGYPAGSQAGLTVLEEIDRVNVPAHASRMGNLLHSRLKDGGAGNSRIGDVRGRGLSMGVELVMDQSGKVPATALAALTVYRAFELGLAINYCGTDGNVIELVPPLTINEHHIEWLAATLLQAIDDAACGKVNETLAAEFAGW